MKVKFNFYVYRAGTRWRWCAAIGPETVAVSRVTFSRRRDAHNAVQRFWHATTIDTVRVFYAHDDEGPGDEIRRYVIRPKRKSA